MISFGEAHSHQADHHHASNSDDTDQTHSHEKEDATSDGCCNDITNSFLGEAKLLANQSRLEFSSDYVFLAPDSWAIESPVVNSSGAIVRYVDPPPKVSDIRIFIQSFII